MSQELHWYPTNAGADSKPVVWKLEGGQALWLASSCAFGFVLFRFLFGNLDWPVIASLVVSGIPPLATTAFLLRFVTGKPKSYAADFLEWQSLKLKRWLAECGVPVRSKALIATQQPPRSLTS